MATAVDAASILLTTRDGTVLLGERSEAIVFLGGYCAFPGGALEDADRTAAAALGLDPLVACALRETVEETGLALDGRKLRPADHGASLTSLDLDLDQMEIHPVGRWVTPEYSPIRFDTRFFLAVIDAPPQTAPVPREFSWARFAPAAEWLDRWKRFELLLPPPTLLGLEALEHGVRGAPERLRAIDTESWIEFEPVSGIRQLPLRSPTLPPATHTNAYVLGHDRVLVVDPAPYELSERERLLSLLEQLGKEVHGIFLTHHHRDHVGAANWLRRQIGAPVLAHPLTASLIEDRIRVDQLIEEGDRIDLGSDRTGQSFQLEALHTPGHAAGHLVLDDLRPGGRSLIAGDMVAAIGTIIVDPSEGDMGEYIRQLRRLRALPQKIIFPAHGPPVLNGHGKLDQYVHHRLMREEKVIAALEAKAPATAAELLPIAYDDTPEKIWPLAERSCLAHLLKLVEEGRVHRRGDRFALR